MIKDGNSIFIFEVAGLCIGHLGHLHHKLDETHFAAIGRLDIVMVPIDGTYTMSLDGISDITRRLRASVVLPMHRFATPLDEFMGLIGQQFQIDQRAERTLKISRETLPSTPTVIILDGFNDVVSIERSIQVSQRQSWICFAALAMTKKQGVKFMAASTAPASRAGSTPIRAKTGLRNMPRRSSIPRGRSSIRIIISGIAAGCAT